MSDEQLKHGIINSFADAYQNLGYSSLMGKIVALLLITDQPLSLDEISEQLEMSKGPVSQITRRLKEHHLIERVWVPGDRRDFYRATQDIFGAAFQNYRSSIRLNWKIADTYAGHAAKANDTFIENRMKEMRLFYDLMEKHNAQFLEEWKTVHENFVKEESNV